MALGAVRPKGGRWALPELSLGTITDCTPRTVSCLIDAGLRRNQRICGAKLFREWHGELHEVLVLEKGFAWRGETHASLSSIARAITGTRWNGWAFFGLKRRAKEASANA
jgi:hypothetical protein